MPKNKRDETDSDTSDSGPDDRVVAKKKKEDSSSTVVSSRKLKTKNGESYWELDRFKRATVREFKGKIYVDLREFYDKGGEILPGKKGISLKLEQWSMLKRVMDEIDAEVSNLG